MNAIDNYPHITFHFYKAIVINCVTKTKKKVLCFGVMKKIDTLGYVLNEAVLY